MKIGDYVRTKQKGFQPPQIAKIKSMKKDAGYKNQYFIELDHNLLPDYNFYVYEEDIAKSRPRIIDLIERFDLVNGHLVICKMYEDEKNIPTMIKCVGGYYFKEENIQNVVTKEQFEAMEYKIESEVN